MSPRYHGHCMCGAIAFTFSGAPRFVVDCVCLSCRRAHGATAVAWVGVEQERFQLTQGSESLRWHRSSAASERGFCTACGSKLFFRSERWPGEMHMAVAAIDTPHDLVSTGIVFQEEFPAWTALTAPPPPTAP